MLGCILTIRHRSMHIADIQVPPPSSLPRPLASPDAICVVAIRIGIVIIVHNIHGAEASKLFRAVQAFAYNLEVELSTIPVCA